MTVPAYEEIWLGLDLGTQSARALAVTGDGFVVGAGRSPLTSHRDGRLHEQDPDDWWQSLGVACRDALGNLDADAVLGLALCGTSGTILLVDRAGQPLTAGLMYDDGRATREADAVNDAGAELWSRLGYRTQPSWALPKLLWLTTHRPELVRSGRMVHQPDYVAERLVGTRVPADSSHALKSGYDPLAERWPTAVLDVLGVPTGVLPDVIRAGGLLGRVCAAAAEHTGIPAGTPVVAGMTDGCAAQLGAGALGVGDWNSVLGTTLVLKGVTEDLLHDPAGVVYSHRSPEGSWLPGGASSTGAGVLTERFPGRDLDALSECAAKRGPTPVIAYPLASRGERFPFTAPDAEGFLLGTPSDDVDHYAALLQGVAFIERLCFDYLDSFGAPSEGQLSFTGGGTRSRYWSELRADVLGRTVRLPANAEAALGMAVLAAYGCTRGRSLRQVANRMVRVREIIEPRGDRDRLTALYLRLVDELTRRGWVQEHVAAHAHTRATA